MSLGFQNWVCLVLPLKHAEVMDCEHFWVDVDAENIVKSVTNVSVTDDSPFRGVPTEVVQAGSTPADFGYGGLTWRQVGPLQSLVPFAIVNKVQLYKDDMQALCVAHNIDVSKLQGQKSISKLAPRA